MPKLVNAKKMLQEAYAGKYAVGHFNINNLEWTQAILKAAQAENSPVILGVSEGAGKYMGGFKTIVGMVYGLLDYLKITVPVVLHLDHGQSVESCKAALDAGFTSVMFDGSHLPLAQNLEQTKEVVAYAKKHNASVEGEVGTIGGEEDGVIASGELASPEDALKLKATGVDVLAAGIGNIHGVYPAGWKGLSFDTLKAISTTIKMPMVLHGGSGIPMDQVLKAIKLGINKINVNTECQIVFTEATRGYFEANKDKADKGYDPRKVLKPGTDAITAKVRELIQAFGCNNKA